MPKILPAHPLIAQRAYNTMTLLHAAGSACFVFLQLFYKAETYLSSHTKAAIVDEVFSSTEKRIAISKDIYPNYLSLEWVDAIGP